MMIQEQINNTQSVVKEEEIFASATRGVGVEAGRG
jgi:hypothetical protein